MRRPRTRPRTDLIGRRIYRLVVIAYIGDETLPSGRKRPRFRCKCDCGTELSLGYLALHLGTAKSCGCLTRELRTTHGDSKTKLYSVWNSMHSRCTEPSHQSYKWYGAKGIKVCERWNSYENFKADMGKIPSGGTLDRIDPRLDYEPSNCRWASTKEQARNKTKSRYIEFAGERKTLADWAVSTGQTYCRLSYRLKRGWPIAEALTLGKSRGMRRDLE